MAEWISVKDRLPERNIPKNPFKRIKMNDKCMKELIKTFIGYSDIPITSSRSDLTIDVSKKSKWISVKDRLPEEGERVLIYRIGEPLSIDYMIDLTPKPPIWACLYEDEMYKVTHWKPLPEPPND